MAANAPAETYLPETDGSIRITVPEVSRVAVYLKETEAAGNGRSIAETRSADS